MPNVNIQNHFYRMYQQLLAIILVLSTQVLVQVVCERGERHQRFREHRAWGREHGTWGERAHMGETVRAERMVPYVPVRYGTVP